MKVQNYFYYSMTGIFFVTLMCFVIEPYIGYQSVGLFLMLNILIASFTGKTKVVLFTGGLSALAWNFFFITPRYHFSVSSTQDRVMILTYFIVSLIMAIIASRIHNHKQIIESERLYRAIFDSVSHELKTPLTAMVGSASAISMENLDAETQKILIYEIMEAGQRLNLVINNLLDMSRIRSGLLKPKKEVIEMNTFVSEFVDRHQSRMQNMKISFEPSEKESYILADEGLLENIFFNLFKNSQKHGGVHPKLEIKISMRNNLLEISLRDFGLGVKDADLDKIFDPFFSSEKSEGLGLGLSIAKAFVEALDGKIQTVNLEKHSGFIVAIRFPVFDLKKSGFVDVN
jgi:two-component system sensor histidine kinase KdpD